MTPPAFHREISTFALEAGLPVLSEKPLASTLADAAAIVQKANETGVLYMVAQIRPPGTSCQDNIKSLRRVFDVIKSCETGQPTSSGGGSNERDGFNL